LASSVKYVLVIAALILTTVFSLKLGAVNASWADVRGVFDTDPDAVSRAILKLRWPRIVGAAVVGCYLAVAGLLFQILLRNPLADPTIFGVSSGAALAVVIAMNIVIALANITEGGASASYLPTQLVPPIAMGGALLASFAVVALAWKKGMQPLRLLLFGAVLAVVLNGAVMTLVLSLSEARTELAILWLAGSLYARDIADVLPGLWWGLGCFLAIGFYARSLSALRFDRDTAHALGVETKVAVPILLMAAAALAASAVAIAGPVGFVGLLVPHITRLVFGSSVRHMLIGSALFGALLVMLSDLVGRMIAPPLELPVGIVTSLIGAPFFAVLIRQSLRKVAL